MGRRVNVYVPDDALVKEYEEMAEADDRSLSSMICEALKYYRDRKKDEIMNRKGTIFDS